MFIVQIDLAGAEWFVTGYLANEPNMIKVHKEGLSPHEHTGFLMTGVEHEVIKAENKVIEDNNFTDPDEITECRKQNFPEMENANWLPRSSSIRQAAKKSNHGLNYGLGYKNFALHNEMMEAEAKQLVDLYRNKAYPALPKWYESLKQELQDNQRCLENCFGRKVRLLGSWKPDLFNKAFSFKPQSTIGDITRQVVASIYNDNYPSQVLQQVHDSVVFQLKEKNIKDHANYISKVAFSEKYLRPKLTYSEQDFYIESDAKVNYNVGKKGAVGLKLTQDVDKQAEYLKEALEKLNAGK